MAGPLSDVMDPIANPPAAPPTTPAGVGAGQAGLLDLDGNPVVGPARLQQEMLGQGYQLDTPENRTKAQLRQKYGEGVGNSLTAAGLAALSTATLGGSDEALVHTGAFSPEALAAYQDMHPVANAAGSLVGAVAPALLGDEVSPLGLLSKGASTASEALGGGVAAKLAASSVEGSFYGLGQAVHEDALGEPGLTAQNVVANMGLGGLLGLGGAVAGAGVSKAWGKLAGVVPTTVDGVVGKINNVALGTPEADTAYTIAHPDLIVAAPEVSDITGAIDDHVAGVKQAWEGTGQAQEGALQAVKAIAPDNNLVADLEAVKSRQMEVIHNNSQQVDAFLGQSPIEVPVENITAELNRHRNAVAIGSGDAASLSYLDQLSERVNALPQTQVPDPSYTGQGRMVDSGRIPINSLRGIIQSLRGDAKAGYGLGAGEFAAAKAATARDAAEALNPIIKQVPGVPRLLADSKARFDALDAVRPYFGTENSALSGFKAAAGDQAKDQLRLAALQQFDAATGSNFVGRLKPYQDANQVAQGLKAPGATVAQVAASIANPGPEIQALHSAALAHEGASTSWDAVKALSPNRSQAIVQSYMSKTAGATKDGLVPKFSLQDAKALTHLAGLQHTDPRLGGQTIFDSMRARGVLDRFSQSKANGSRNAFIFGSVGTALGSVFGPAGALTGETLGSIAGGAVDRSGGLVAKKIALAVGQARKANPLINPKLGDLVLKKLGPDAIRGLKVGAISQIIQHLHVQSNFDPKAEQRASSLGQLERQSNATTGRLQTGLQRFYEGGQVESQGREATDAGEAVKTLQELVSNPMAIADRVHAHTAALADMAPKVASGVNDTAVRAVNYLATKIPPRLGGAALDGAPPSQSKAHIAAFRDALGVANDPLSVLEHASRGSLTPAHVEALQAVYPDLYQNLQAEALNALPGQDAVKLSFHKKTALSKLVGAPLVSQLQPQAIAAAQGTQAPIPQPAPQGAVKPSQKGLSNLSVANRSQTDFQQSASRRNG